MKTYFQLWLEGYENNKCTVDGHELPSMLEDADQPYLVMPVKMTEEEFNSLPEFMGF